MSDELQFFDLVGGAVACSGALVAAALAGRRRAVRDGAHRVLGVGGAAAAIALFTVAVHRRAAVALAIAALSLAVTPIYLAIHPEEDDRRTS